MMMVMMVMMVTHHDYSAIGFTFLDKHLKHTHQLKGVQGHNKRLPERIGDFKMEIKIHIVMLAVQLIGVKPYVPTSNINRYKGTDTVP